MARKAVSRTLLDILNIRKTSRGIPMTIQTG